MKLFRDFGQKLSDAMFGENLRHYLADKLELLEFATSLSGLVAAVLDWIAIRCCDCSRCT